MTGRLLALMLLLLPGTAWGQSFSWFATTMGGPGTEHASVVVLPSSAWVLSDSTASLTNDATRLVEAAHERGAKVVASVPAQASQRALTHLWSGSLDGLIVVAGSLSGQVARPETSVVLADAPGTDGVDGALSTAPFPDSDWDALDALYAARAPTMDQPTPTREVVVVPLDAGASRLFAPGSILLPGAAPASWNAALAFRAGHPAIAGGLHERLPGDAYAFYRGMRVSRDETDEVVIVLGAQGKTRVNVASIFDDDTLLREAASGQIALVTFGQAAFKASADGTLLIEVVK